MVSNCSLHRLHPLDPAVDPAYQDGPAPTPRRPSHAGALDVALPMPHIPAALEGAPAISLEVLEDTIEREARREERS